MAISWLCRSRLLRLLGTIFEESVSFICVGLSTELQFECFVSRSVLLAVQTAMKPFYSSRQLLALLRSLLLVRFTAQGFAIDRQLVTVGAELIVGFEPSEESIEKLLRLWLKESIEELLRLWLNGRASW